MLSCNMSCHIISYHIISCHVVLYNVMSYHVTLYHVMSCHDIIQFSNKVRTWSERIVVAHVPTQKWSVHPKFILSAMMLGKKVKHTYAMMLGKKWNTHMPWCLEKSETRICHDAWKKVKHTYAMMLGKKWNTHMPWCLEKKWNKHILPNDTVVWWWFTMVQSVRNNTKQTNPGSLKRIDRIDHQLVPICKPTNKNTVGT